MSNAMPALTVWQPWASLIAEGFKPFEFRRWPAPAKLVGRRIAIHAGARPMKPKEVRDLLAQMRCEHPNPALDVACIPLLEQAMKDPKSIPTRAVVCIATLGEPVSPSGIRARFANDSDRDQEFSWGWPMLDVQRLTPPIPASGAQGFWSWRTPSEIAA